GSFDVEWVDRASAGDTSALVRPERNKPQGVGAMVAAMREYTNDPWGANLRSQLISRVREWVKERVPPYMVPSVIVMLDALPLTENGKVDRRGLSVPDVRVQAQQEYVAPRTPTEDVLSRLWKQV